MDKIRTAVIGCGAISDAYMNNLKNRFTVIELAACTDLDESRSRAKAEKYGIPVMTTEQILADPSIGMVVNLTNPAAHYAVNKAALLAGKHVYSEKMIAVTAAEADELIAIAEEKGVQIGTAPDTFLGATLQTARYLIDHGVIGQVVSCEASMSRNYGIYGDILPHLRKPGGGICMDVGCYYMTALAALLGPAEQVFAYSGTSRPERIDSRTTNASFGQPYTLQVENAVAASVRYRSGVIGTLHFNSDCIFDEDRSLKIFGTEGILSIDDPNQFGSKLTLRKPFHPAVEFPFTHGFENESRGLGAAELAWSVYRGRTARTAGYMNRHLLEMIGGMLGSGESGRPYTLRSAFTQPAMLPPGYVSREEYGMWSPTEETALA